jgi:hypothetical protein
MEVEVEVEVEWMACAVHTVGYGRASGLWRMNASWLAGGEQGTEHARPERSCPWRDKFDKCKANARMRVGCT